MPVSRRFNAKSQRRYVLSNSFLCDFVSLRYFFNTQQGDRVVYLLLLLRSRLAPLHHTAVRRHIDRQDLAACWVEQFIPQIRVTKRKFIRPQCGSHHSGQMRVVAVIQYAIQLILCPHRARTTAFQVIQNQQRRGADLMEAPVK